MDNPYHSPESYEFTPDTSVRREYGGIQRLPYFVINVALEIAQLIICFMILSAARVNARVDAPGLELSVALLLVGLFFIAPWMVTVYYRLMNIGMQPLWCLLVLVPCVNLFIAIVCLVCPEGYADTRKLDGPAKFVVGIFVAFFVLLHVLLLLARNA